MVKFGKVKIKEPIIIASGPLTDKFSKIKLAQKHGAGAVSLKLTFVKIPFPSQMRSYSLPDNTIITPTNKRLNIKEATRLMRKIKKEISIIMFANYGAVGTKIDEWLLQSEEFQKAGADILELNFCCPNLETTKIEVGKKRGEHGGTSIAENPETSYRIVEKVKQNVDIPVVVKIGGGDIYVILETAKGIEEAGAQGIHVVGIPITGLPPVDENGISSIPLMSGIAQGSVNGAVCKYSTFLLTALLAQAVKIPIISSGGLSTWKDCIDVIMWGASSPSICSVVMWYGYEVVEAMNTGIENFMQRKNYKSFDDFRGLALKELTTPDKVKLLEGTSVVDPEKCIGCGRCVKPGHCEAMKFIKGKAKVKEKNCIGCGVCQGLCPSGAITYKLK